MKIKIDNPIIVEGKYDKIKLSNIFDARIITTEGFGIFKNSDKEAMIRRLAEKTPIIVLSDSDGAGMVIRNRLKSILPENKIINIYLPEIEGKERRKRQASKQGLLGVEGTNDEIIIEAFKKAGIGESKSQEERVTKLDLYNLGLAGASESGDKRRKLLEEMKLPKNLSANSLLEMINVFYTREEFLEILERVKDNGR